MKILLEQQGINVVLNGEALVGLHPVLGSVTGGIKLQVLKSDGKFASQFIQDNRREVQKANKPEVTFECEECGKPLSFPGTRRGGVETCPNCREYIDVPD